jgi:hypothetical protein
MIKNLMYGEILSLLLSSIVELLISGFLGVQAPVMFPFNMAVSVWFLVIPFIFLPAMFVWLFIHDIKSIREEAFNQKFGALTVQIDLKRKSNTTYFFIFVLRRNLFVIFSVIFEKYPIF